MSKRKKYITIAAVLVVGIIASIFWLMRQLRISLMAAEVIMMSEFIKGIYIEESGGCFPASEADLKKKAGLHETVSDSGIEYYYRRDNYDYKFPAHYFVMFKLRYGVSLENTEMVNGKLYDKSSSEEILLIEGPYKEALKEKYESISRYWYESMLEARQRSQNSEAAGDSRSGQCDDDQLHP